MTNEPRPERAEVAARLIAQCARCSQAAAIAAYVYVHADAGPPLQAAVCGTCMGKLAHAERVGAKEKS